jgi:hypothetical protein
VHPDIIMFHNHSHTQLSVCSSESKPSLEPFRLACTLINNKSNNHDIGVADCVVIDDNHRVCVDLSRDTSLSVVCVADNINDDHVDVER